MIGYVPQMLSADSTLTGYENLLLFAKLHDLPRLERAARIGRALAFMGLEDSAGRLVREYSGGMIRRLEIAQSMLHRPQVLFLDEPTVGLDPIARNSVWERLRQLQAELGTTVFLTTHVMEEADALCQQIAILGSMPSNRRLLHPLAIIPAWLRVIARVNPLSYEVDALCVLVATDLTVLAGTAIVLVAIAARLYPRVAT